MQSGGFPSLPKGDAGPSNLRDGEYAGPRFPSWGDPNGDFSKLTILRLAAESGSLPAEPFLLRQSVESHLKTKVESAYPEARGVSYAIKFRNPQMVEKLLNMKQLTNGFPVKVTKHPVLNTSKCVISCAESTKYNTAQIVEGLKDQGVIDCRQITRKVSDGSGGENGRVSTPTIILTIDGTIIPQHISFGWIRCKTRPYYPAPMVCFSCFEFGHTRTRCQRQESPVCGNCSAQHTASNDSPCSLTAFCKRCNTNDHQLSSRKCPVYVREEEIQHIRVDMGISYAQAKRTYEQQNNSQTMASVINASNDQRFNELSAKFDQLLVDVGKKDAQIDSLIAELLKRDKEIEKKDKRITKLENYIKSNPNNRLDIAQQYGTIQDMLDRVRFLEAELAKKNKPLSPAMTHTTVKNIASGTSTHTQRKNNRLETQNQITEANSEAETEAPRTPENSHTKTKKTRRTNVSENTNTNQNTPKEDTVEHLPKRLKSTTPAMYISDSEPDGNTCATDAMEYTTSDFNVSSEDETMEAAIGPQIDN